jgi:hypothetical protein
VFSEKSDVWAYGVMLHEIASYGVLPYESVKNKDVQQHILDGHRLPLPGDPMPAEFYKLAQSCWQDVSGVPGWYWKVFTGSFTSSFGARDCCGCRRRALDQPSVRLPPPWTVLWMEHAPAAPACVMLVQR